MPVRTVPTLVSMSDGPAATARQRFATSAVARLATVTPAGTPHLVPVVFAVDHDTVYTAVDGKPKSTQHLRRVANVVANPNVSLLVDHYDDDWAQLWWVRADGVAAVHADDATARQGRTALRAKYSQYQSVSLDGPVLSVRVTRWSWWSA